MTSGNTIGNQSSFGSTNASRKDNASTANRALHSAKAGGENGKAVVEKRPSKRGFAAMDPSRQREIAAQGGRAAHESGNAHQFTSEEARAAGKKSHSGQRRSSSAVTVAGRKSIDDRQAASTEAAS